MVTELQATPNTPWVLVDHDNTVITCGPGILFVYPSDVGEAYNKFVDECGGFVCTDDIDAVETLHEAVSEHVAEWARNRPTPDA